MTVPEHILDFFRTAPLNEATDALCLFKIIVKGREALGENTYPGTLREACESVLRDAGHPMRVREILAELNSRYPGRVKKTVLRSCLYPNARDPRSPIIRLGLGLFGLRDSTLR